MKAPALPPSSPSSPSSPLPLSSHAHAKLPGSAAAPASELIDSLDGPMNAMTIDVQESLPADRKLGGDGNTSESTSQPPPPPPTPHSSGRHTFYSSTENNELQQPEVETDENVSDENIMPASSSSPTGPAALSPQPCGPKIAKHGLVADIFSGILCSEISCDNCGVTSRVKERFSDVSLPIPATHKL